MALDRNPSTQEAESGGGSQGPQPGLPCEFKASLGYTVSLKNTKNESNHTKKASVRSWLHVVEMGIPFLRLAQTWASQEAVGWFHTTALSSPPQGMLGKAKQRWRLLHIQNL